MKLFAAFVCAVMFLAGCAATPSKQWAQGREALTTTQNVLLQQAAAGNLSGEDLIAIDPLIQSARTALDVAETQLPEGGKSFESYMQIVESILTKLLEIQAKESANGNRSHSLNDRGSQGNHLRPRLAGPAFA
jgi:hypothetical protein